MAMDREKLKRATSRRQPGVPPTKESKLTDALPPPPKALTLKGREYRLEPLDLSDLCEIEEAHGVLSDFFGAVQAGSAVAVRYLYWLIFRKTDPDLTLEEAGRLLTIEELTTGAITAEIMTASGVKGGSTHPEESETEPAAATGEASSES